MITDVWEYYLFLRSFFSVSSFGGVGGKSQHSEHLFLLVRYGPCELLSSEVGVWLVQVLVQVLDISKRDSGIVPRDAEDLGCYNGLASAQ